MKITELTCTRSYGYERFDGKVNGLKGKKDNYSFKIGRGQNSITGKQFQEALQCNLTEVQVFDIFLEIDKIKIL